jgi:hypothetical protein
VEGFYDKTYQLCLVSLHSGATDTGELSYFALHFKPQELFLKNFLYPVSITFLSTANNSYHQPPS